MNLSELLSSMRLGAGTVHVAVSEDWLQGRSLFGGLQAAIGLCAMRTLVPATTPLRTLQVTFIAPVEGGEVSASARVLRTGKSATHVEARLENAQGLQAILIGVFGTPRTSIVRVQVPAPAPTSGKRQRMSFVAGITPSFMQQFDVELVAGAIPFSGTPVNGFAFDLGLRDPGPVTEAHLLAFADFVPPVALTWMPKPVPGSSLTWMIELLDYDFAAQPVQGWRAQTQMLAARDGYISQTTTLWAPDGKAVALSTQSMVVFG